MPTTYQVAKGIHASRHASGAADSLAAYFVPKSGRSISVKDAPYSAVGDGVNDDTAEIAAAIAAAGAASTPLYIPPGTYLTSSTLNFTSLTGVDVIGNQATVICTDPTAPILYFNGCSKFEISGLTVQHQNATIRNSSGYGLRFDTCTDYMVRGNRVIATGAAGIISFTGLRGTIIGNTVRETLADGIHQSNGSSHISVVGNHMYHTGDDGIAVVSYQSNANLCTDVTITGNTIQNGLGRGIAVVGGQKVGISGNVIDATKFSGIYVAQEPGYTTYGVTNVTVASNTINAANTVSPTADFPSIYVYGGNDGTALVSNVTVANNNINGGGGSFIKSDSSGGVQLTNIQIIGNNCFGPNALRDGILMDHTTDGVITGNHVYMAYDSGIYVAANATPAHVGFNSVVYPNQHNNAGHYGVANLAGSNCQTPLNMVLPDGTKAALVNNNFGTDQTFTHQINGGLLATTLQGTTHVRVQSGSRLFSGSGAPGLSATAGDLYFRTDTPSTANQRIYICTGGSSWTALTV